MPERKHSHGASNRHERNSRPLIAWNIDEPSLAERAIGAAKALLPTNPHPLTPNPFLAARIRALFTTHASPRTDPRMSQSYTAQDIEVLSGLEPVRRRPGMYTDTSRPNHLAHEVVDNSVDEALAGHCSKIDVTLYKDGSLEVVDDGRGMPVDIHPKEKVSGVELILTRLHAGGKFSADSGYKFSGGLHGVGVSVVNALSKHLECWVRRGGKEYNIAFKNGKVHSKLEVVGEVGKSNTGTTVRFWPDTSYFDSPDFALPKLKHVLKAKAVLCPGLRVRFNVEKTGEKEEWLYSEGLSQYLRESLESTEWLPDEPFVGKVEGEHEGVDWAVVWRIGRRHAVRGELRQPDPDRAGRHARQRFPPRPDRGRA